MNASDPWKSNDASGYTGSGFGLNDNTTFGSMRTPDPGEQSSRGLWLSLAGIALLAIVVGIALLLG